MVLICNQTAPGGNDESTLGIVSSIAAIVGTIVRAMPAPRTASAGVAEAVAPAAASRAVAAGFGSHTLTRIPAASSLRENADPMVPAPMTAICSAMHFVIHTASTHVYRQSFGETPKNQPMLFAERVANLVLIRQHWKAWRTPDA
jgi:hypothetical protein